jgi:hypothetical protein
MTDGSERTEIKKEALFKRVGRGFTCFFCFVKVTGYLEFKSNLIVEI